MNEWLSARLFTPTMSSMTTLTKAGLAIDMKKNEDTLADNNQSLMIVKP